MIKKKDKILVAGGGGFLGKQVMHELLARGYSHITSSSITELDFRNKHHADTIMCMATPDVVINCAAAVGGISANIQNPGSFFYDNLSIGMNLLESARQHHVKKFVQIGSACEYPKYAPMPLQERDIWNGYPENSNASYGIAKRALLEMGRAYRLQYGMSVIHLLPTNLYGPGDNFGDNSHFIPAMIKRAVYAADSKIQHIGAWGTGSATRDFLYVQDAAEGVVSAMERWNRPDPVNLGSGREISIRETAEKIAWLSGFRGHITWDTNKTDGQPRRVLDTTKAKEFRWEAETLLEAGLSRTIEWYRAKSR